jgi:hypothetical protein
MASSTGIVFDRESLARWYAERHLDLDDGAVLILHLPTNAPDREIRFLEVNTLISETTPPEPIDFGVDIDGPDPHTLYVLDVTPAQWMAIQAGTLPLPNCWTLAGSQELGRR